MRNIPTITKNLLIINVLMFAAYFVFSRLNINLNSLLGLHFFLVSDFHLYQLVTYMFMHAGLSHIFFNMFALWMFGRIVETVWGPKRFLTYYLTCGIGAGLIQMVAQFISFYLTMKGAYPEFGIGDVMTAVHANEFALNTWTQWVLRSDIRHTAGFRNAVSGGEDIHIPATRAHQAKWFVAIYAVLELSLGLGMPGDSVHISHTSAACSSAICSSAIGSAIPTVDTAAVSMVADMVRAMAAPAAEALPTN